jgi:hypothetical protein
MTQPQIEGLPALPEPTLEDVDCELWGQNAKMDCYSAEQMHAYASAAIEADRAKRKPQSMTRLANYSINESGMPDKGPHGLWQEGEWERAMEACGWRNIAAPGDYSCWTKSPRQETHATPAQAGLDEQVRKDAALFRWLHDLKCSELILTRNGDHACNYMTAAQWIDDNPEDFEDCDPAEVERMRATNTIWRLQVYPDTPIGFLVWHGSTPEAAIDAAMASTQEKK